MLSGTATARNTRLAEFTESQKIGEGTYGQVYKARDTSGEWVALKKLRLDDNGEGVPVTTLREVALLKELVHDNIVRLRDVVAAPPKLYLVFDYHEQDLKQCMDKHFRDGMPGTLIKTCIMQILRGVAYCHSKRVLHRDLKPQNVLIDVSGRVKLADFGLARVLQNLNPQHYTHEVVTLWYRAPELLLGKREYSMSVDTWSIGCIFAELCCRKPLFPGDSEIDQLFRIFRCLGTPTEDLWPGCTQLPNFQECFPKWTPKRMREEVPNIEEGGADLLAHLVIYTAERRVNVNRFRSAQPTAAPARTNHVRVCNSPLPSRPAPGSRRASAPILRRGTCAPRHRAASALGLFRFAGSRVAVVGHRRVARLCERCRRCPSAARGRRPAARGRLAERGEARLASRRRDAHVELGGWLRACRQADEETEAHAARVIGRPGRRACDASELPCRRGEVL
jgi:serine/threonine protein kinase